MLKIQVFFSNYKYVDLLANNLLLPHLQNGDLIQIVMLVKGQNGACTPKSCSIAAIRQHVASTCREKMPGADLKWLNYYDGKIHYRVESAQIILDSIAEWQPHIVYLPEIQNIGGLEHSDHLTTCELIDSAIQEYPNPLILRYYQSQSNSPYRELLKA